MRQVEEKSWNVMNSVISCEEGFSLTVCIPTLSFAPVNHVRWSANMAEYLLSTEQLNHQRLLKETLTS